MSLEFCYTPKMIVTLLCSLLVILKDTLIFPYHLREKWLTFVSLILQGSIIDTYVSPLDVFSSILCHTCDTLSSEADPRALQNWKRILMVHAMEFNIRMSSRPLSLQSWCRDRGEGVFPNTMRYRRFGEQIK